MRSSSTHYGKGWTFVVCELETDSWAESETAVCVFGAWDSDALHSVSSRNPRRQPRRVTWNTARRSNVRTHFFPEKTCVCMFFLLLQLGHKQKHRIFTF